MTPDLRPPDLDEPALRSPELRRFVAAARAAPAPVLRVTSDAIFAGFAARQRHRRRLGLGLGLAAAAALALVWQRPASRPNAVDPVARNMSPKTVSGDPVTLAQTVRIVAEEGESARVRGPWDVELAPGRYDITVAAHAGPEQLRVATPSGTVEITHGRVAIIVAGARTEAVLRTGVATWIAPDGARTALAVQPASEDMFDPSASPSELARHADELLAAGRQDAAIRVLDRLVLDHPDSPPARAALLDLARLLKAAARVDEARCAYALYLDRYPAREQLADEVADALARLGPGPACAGLRPR